MAAKSDTADLIALSVSSRSMPSATRSVAGDIRCHTRCTIDC
ncbi:hypothetical protein M758_3G171000 [Ceratodon purpureus]|nr:hypothetical protein M758_3G171000 [Ceratodon purpureus]